MKKVKVIERLPADFKTVLAFNSEGREYSTYYIADAKKWSATIGNAEIVEWVDTEAPSDEEIELKKLKFQLKIAEIKLKYADMVIQTPLLAGAFMIQLATVS